MEALSLKSYSLGTENYSIFESWHRGQVYMVHFIWGKKDFRIYLDSGALGHKEKDSGRFHARLLDGDEEIRVSRLQYLYHFEWYDFDEVVGHGKSREEIRWLLGKEKHVVELPKDFFLAALELAIREHNLKRVK
ncbi:MAG: hypothetical protein OEV94_07215 [Deltaproteobacteria bacterium]|nr:hypothetical protein [Deltaproteobacteria bacterium]